MKSLKNKTKPIFKAIPFLAPFVIVYLLFLVYPVFRGLWMSLHRWTMVRKIDFVGLANYVDMIQDPAFWSSLGHTTLFVLLSTPTIVIAGLIFALICNQKLKGTIFLKISFFMPYVLSVAVISSIMVFLFKPHNGFINTFLSNIGLEQTIFWLGQEKLAWFVIVFATLWWTVGFNMILYLAALQDIPKSYYEAAKVDGATEFQLFWNITLPMLRPITWTVTLLQIIFSYKIFAQVWLITGGGPGTATRPIIQYIYETAFKQNNLGYGAAQSYTLFLIIVVVSLIQIWLRKRREN